MLDAVRNVALSAFAQSADIGPPVVVAFWRPQLMAITLNKLTGLDVRSINEPGRYADGGNLYLLVGRKGAKSWASSTGVGARTGAATWTLAASTR